MLMKLQQELPQLLQLGVLHTQINTAVFINILSLELMLLS